MVVAVRATKTEQTAWCRLAREGDTVAEGRLAVSVSAWVRKKAGEYGRQYGADPDDLEGEAWSRFKACVKAFDLTGESGSFMNYFANAAARTMMEACRREATGRSRVRTVRTTDDGNDPQPDGIDPSRGAAAEAFAALDPLSREILRLVTGMDGRAIDFPEAARRLGITERRCRAFYIIAAGTVRAAVSNAA